MDSPKINSFGASPEEITSGQSSTLNWSISDATDVTITPEIGDVPLVGSETVSPARTTTYTITATNEAGSVKSSIDVVVGEPILSTPKQISPADGTLFDDYPNEITLEWTEVPGATIYGVEVEVYLGYWGNVITSYVTTNSYTFGSTGTYPGRWRVWAVDSMDRKSEKSDWWGYSYTT